MDRLEKLLEFYEEDPNDAFTRFSIAREYLKRGNKEEALRFYGELLDDHPDYVGTYYHLGKLYESMDRRDAAIEVYEEGVKVARSQRAQKDLSELQDALLQAQGVGFD